MHHLPLDHTWFVTGITGFLGSYLTAELLWRTDGRARILALVRPSKRASACERVIEALEPLVGHQGALDALQSIDIVSGDVTKPQLGLTDREYWHVAERASIIIHAAASISFDIELADARHINVEGTRRILDLARHAAELGHAPRMVYVSTAYVSGASGGVIQAKDLCVERPFTNAYERSKAEAETLVRSHMSDLSLTVVRPSIVIGDSVTGYPKEFSTLYYAFRIIHHGLLPYSPEGHIDCVPVDYVTQGILAAACDPRAIGRTFHLTAGSDRQLRWEQFAPAVIERVARRTGKQLKHEVVSAEDYLSRFEDRHQLSSRRRFVVEQFRSLYAPYLMQQTKHFQDDETRILLAGIRPPEPHEMIDLVAGYCMETRWGSDPRGHSAWGEVLPSRRMCA